MAPPRRVKSARARRKELGFVDLEIQSCGVDLKMASNGALFVHLHLVSGNEEMYLPVEKRRNWKSTLSPGSPRQTTASGCHPVITLQSLDTKNKRARPTRGHCDRKSLLTCSGIGEALVKAAFNLSLFPLLSHFPIRVLPSGGWPIRVCACLRLSTLVCADSEGQEESRLAYYYFFQAT